MSGINHLYDIYKKKGEGFIQELFNSYVTVNEKMDGSAFGFEKTPSGKFNFYKRDQRRPITLVDRTLMKYYEKPIQYIESLPMDVVNRIPTGWRFGTEYFSSNQPQEIVYDRTPKNHMILSYIHKKDPMGNITETIQDQEKLNLWAEILGIERPPIVFQGRLSDEQKIEILDFVNTPFSDLISEFKTKSFVRYILNVLNPNLDKSALNEDLDKPIEGIVFRFGDPGSDQIVAKMIDPIFVELAKGKEPVNRDKRPNDILSVVIMDVMNFILMKGVNSFSTDGATEDEKYISFISDVFDQFLDAYSSRYQGIDLDEPDHLKKDEFRLNGQFIKSRATRKWIEEDQAYESLFKLILNSFRKIRKNPGGVVSSEALEQFNMLIKDIQNKLQIPEKEVKESLEDFTDFLSFKKNFIVEHVDYLTEEEDSPSFDNFIDAMESVDKDDNSVSDKIPTETDQDRNLYISSFQPFDNTDLKVIQEMHKKNGKPVILCLVHPEIQDREYPISKDTSLDILNSLKSSSEIIGEIVHVKKPFLNTVLEKCGEQDLKPVLLGASTEKFDLYQKQLDYIKAQDKDIDLSLIKFKIPKRDKNLIDLISNGDYTVFKKYVPAEISSKFFEILQNEINRGSHNLEN